MTEKPRKPPSVWGLMTVHTEQGLDQICRQLEKRKARGEKLPTVEDHRRAREKLYGKDK